MSFPRYPKYKPSGVEWLGDVPEGWVVCAPKRRIKSAAGGTLIKGMCSDEYSEGLFPGFSASGQNVWLEEYAYDCPAIVLSAVGARCGKAFKADGQWGVVANTHCLFPLPNSDRDYLWYLTNQEDWWEKGGSAQPFVKVSETMARPWVFPPLPEQTAIAEFLDRETGKIDGLVAEQRRLMELLKEKRQAVISHAVTKGLNPHAPMKPSGIEWLGDVPEHWGVWKLTHAFEKIGSGTTPKTDNREYYDDGTHPWVNTGDLNDGDLTDCEKKITDLALSDHTTLRTYPPGSVVIAMYGATIGKLAILQFPASVNQACCVFSGKLTIEYKFLFFWLLAYRPQIISLASGGGQPNVNQDILRGLRVACPALAEQETIIEFLEAETAKFDTLTAEAQRAIDLLQERRTALISAAVTGQIDVRPPPKN